MNKILEEYGKEIVSVFCDSEISFKELTDILDTISYHILSIANVKVDKEGIHIDDSNLVFYDDETDTYSVEYWSIWVDGVVSHSEFVYDEDDNLIRDNYDIDWEVKDFLAITNVEELYGKTKADE